MKKFLKWFAGIIVILIVIYLAGPRPAKPQFKNNRYSFPVFLTDLETQINNEEKAVKGLKPDNEARIIWADSVNKEKTKIAFLYLHGFSASQGEGDPVHKYLAKRYNANLYLARLYEHGIDRGDSTMIRLNAQDYVASAEKALAITKELGDEVIVIGTSAGGALTLFLASHHPEIKAIVLYSPCISLYNKTAAILNKQWGLQIARLMTGGPVKRNKQDSKEEEAYWQSDYRVEALVALQNLVSNTMKPEIFSAVKCPVFLGYYYKNQEEQDKTVSIPAMLKMFDELGTPQELKLKVDFPDAGRHVIASRIESKDWRNVEKETERFLSEKVKL